MVKAPSPSPTTATSTASSTSTRPARRHGVTPIIGLEAYMAANSRFDRPPRRGKIDDTGGDSEGGQKLYHHLTLLAMTNEGYKNLRDPLVAGVPRGLLLQAAPRLGTAGAATRRVSSRPRGAWAAWCSRRSCRTTTKRPSNSPGACRRSLARRASSSSSKTTASRPSSARTLS